ncbi:hypothetical protein HOY82DRAFT_541497 [Tuber indicum]|nr:hypothetical protein HOY82DRAFT_541497 [Tuber indicum]
MSYSSPPDTPCPYRKSTKKTGFIEINTSSPHFEVESIKVTDSEQEDKETTNIQIVYQEMVHLQFKLDKEIQQRQSLEVRVNKMQKCIDSILLETVEEDLPGPSNPQDADIMKVQHKKHGNTRHWDEFPTLNYDRNTTSKVESKSYNLLETQNHENGKKRLYSHVTADPASPSDCHLSPPNSSAKQQMQKKARTIPAFEAKPAHKHMNKVKCRASAIYVTGMQHMPIGDVKKELAGPPINIQLRYLRNISWIEGRILELLVDSNHIEQTRNRILKHSKYNIHKTFDPLHPDCFNWESSMTPESKETVLRRNIVMRLASSIGSSSRSTTQQHIVDWATNRGLGKLLTDQLVREGIKVIGHHEMDKEDTSSGHEQELRRVYDWRNQFQVSTNQVKGEESKGKQMFKDLDERYLSLLRYLFSRTTKY